MKRVTHSLGFILIIIMVAGCTSSRIALKPEYQEQLTSADTIIEVQQKEIYAEIEDSQIATFSGGGLIPALIDAAIEHNRAKTADNLIRPIRNQLDDYDFRLEFKDTFESKVQAIDWLHGANVEEAENITPSDIMERLSHSSSAILTLQSKYYLTPKFDSVIVEAKISLYLPGVSNQNRKKPKPIYRNNFTSQESITGPEKMSKKLNADYLATNTNWLNEALENGCSQIIDKFVSDIQRIDSVQPETVQNRFKLSTVDKEKEI